MMTRYRGLLRRLLSSGSKNKEASEEEEDSTFRDSDKQGESPTQVDLGESSLD